jgi:hypothetical protein
MFKKEAIEALSDIQSIIQSLGKHYFMLNRCKLGTKRYNEILNAILIFESQAEERKSIIRLALNSLDK